MAGPAVYREGKSLGKSIPAEPGDRRREAGTCADPAAAGYSLITYTGDSCEKGSLRSATPRPAKNSSTAAVPPHSVP